MCKFLIGSYSHALKDIEFFTNFLTYDKEGDHSVLDFGIQILPLHDEDSYSVWASGNYSLAGFEMRLERNSFKYIVNFYLPSGLFVVVSWVGNSIECYLYVYTQL